MSGNNNEEFRRRQLEREIVPDTPTMRSVAIMPPPMPMLRAVEPASVSKSPAIRVGPTMSVNTKSSVSSPELRPNTTPNWRVEQANELPSFYPLERSHIRLSDVTALEVSSRIDECLRKESVAVVYDNQKAIARAETSHCLKFSVILFQERDQIIMEVQKSSGCCFLFNQAVKKLFSAAKSGASEPSKTVGLPMPRSVPSIPDSAWEECTEESLDICRSQLKERRVDAHLLAVESLAQISDKSSKCRSFCAKHVMKPSSELLHAVLSLIQVSRLDTEDSFASELEQQQFAMMHRHAVEILNNCLEVVPSAVSTLPELTCPATLNALLLDVQSAKNKPHEAAAACKCLTLLSKNCKTILMEQDVPSLLHAAVQCRHATLEEECTKLMNTLYN